MIILCQVKESEKKSQKVEEEWQNWQQFKAAGRRLARASQRTQDGSCCLHCYNDAKIKNNAKQRSCSDFGDESVAFG